MENMCVQNCVLSFVTLCGPCLGRKSSVDMEKRNFWSEMQFCAAVIFYHCDHDRKGGGDDEYCDDVEEVVVMIR